MVVEGGGGEGGGKHLKIKHNINWTHRNGHHICSHTGVMIS